MSRVSDDRCVRPGRRPAGVAGTLLRFVLGLVRGALRGVMLVAVVACSVLVFGSVALWEWVSADGKP